MVIHQARLVVEKSLDRASLNAHGASFHSSGAAAAVIFLQPHVVEAVGVLEHDPVVSIA
jgi:hypothetical protein